MEPNALMQMAAALFGLAAGSSLLMAVMNIGGVARSPSWLATGYSILAAAGVAVLCLAALTVGIPVLAEFALGLFSLAMAGGTAASLLLHRKRLPNSVLVFRAFLAGAGFVLLLVSIVGQLYISKLPVPTMIHTG
jgi:hypothetical protein